MTETLFIWLQVSVRSKWFNDLLFYGREITQCCFTQCLVAIHPILVEIFQPGSDCSGQTNSHRLMLVEKENPDWKNGVHHRNTTTWPLSPSVNIKTLSRHSCCHGFSIQTMICYQHRDKHATARPSDGDGDTYMMSCLNSSGLGDTGRLYVQCIDAHVVVH